MLYLWGFPEEHQAEKDHHKLLVQDTTIELELSGNDAETNNKKELQPDEKVLLCARHWCQNPNAEVHLASIFSLFSAWVSITLLLQKIPRNKACPCGSKKKYKSCCGTVSGRSSARFPVYDFKCLYHYL